MPQITIKPNGNVKVRKLNGEHLNPQGETLEDHPYYRRRLREGDVVKTTLSISSKGKAKPAKEV